MDFLNLLKMTDKEGKLESALFFKTFRAPYGTFSDPYLYFFDATETTSTNYVSVNYLDSGTTSGDYDALQTFTTGQRIAWAPTNDGYGNRYRQYLIVCATKPFIPAVGNLFFLGEKTKVVMMGFSSKNSSGQTGIEAGWCIGVA